MLLIIPGGEEGQVVREGCRRVSDISPQDWPPVTSFYYSASCLHFSFPLPGPPGRTQLLGARPSRRAHLGTPGGERAPLELLELGRGAQTGVMGLQQELQQNPSGICCRKRPEEWQMETTCNATAELATPMHRGGIAHGYSSVYGNSAKAAHHQDP